MNISKTTLNYAIKRNLDVTVDICDGVTTVMIWDAEDDCEWLVSYKQGENHLGGVFLSSCLLSQDVKGELPHWIQDEKQLRQVLDFISKSI